MINLSLLYHPYFVRAVRITATSILINTRYYIEGMSPKLRRAYPAHDPADPTDRHGGD